MKDKKKEITVEQKVYAVLLTAGLIALASLTLLYGKKTKQMDDLVEQNIELDEQSPVSGQVSTEKKEETTTQESNVSTAVQKKKSKETAAVSTKAYDGKDKLIWPVSGNVLIPYSMDTTVYFETLDQYQCNPALYIKADQGTSVKAIYEGKITQITKDDRLGQLVTVDMGNGYQITYGQLDQLNYQKGDTIKTGSVIGKIAEPTNYFLLEGSHLYVKMTKDNKPVNPTDYLES